MSLPCSVLSLNTANRVPKMPRDVTRLVLILGGLV